MQYHVTVNYKSHLIRGILPKELCCIAMTTIHTHIHTESQRRHNKDERHSSLEKYTSHFIWKGSKGLLKVLLQKGVGDRTELQHIDPHSYGHNRVSFPFSWAAPGDLGVHSAGCWFSLPHLSIYIQQLAIEGIVYSCTFFWEINNDESCNVKYIF